MRAGPLDGHLDSRESTARYVLDKKGHEIVRARGVDTQCDFEIHRDGKWCVFEGQVDSQRTKTELFDLAPQVDGACWIVDRLRVRSFPVGSDRPTRPDG